jgi:curli biogenesis system outer membrane secretion channel CsgG
VSQDEAEAVLTGKVYEIRSDPLSYDIITRNVQDKVITYEVTSSRRMRIKLDARLVDTKTGKVIWADQAMEEKATFEVSDDPMSNRYNQRKAIREMARRLAKRIYLKTFERF